MLTKLMPDQIANLWDVIKYAVEESLPPIANESPNKMNNILTALLCGDACCWISYTKSEEGSKFEGLVVTKITYDDISNTKSLLIYCLYGFEVISKKSWTDGMKALVKFAVSQGCSSITAYSEVPSIISLVERLGGDTRYRFIRLPLF